MTYHIAIDIHAFVYAKMIFSGLHKSDISLDRRVANPALPNTKGDPISNTQY